MNRAYPGQRSRVHDLMKKAEFDMFRITAAHRMLCREAGVAEPAVGEMVDDWIYSLTAPAASALITHLQDSR